MDLNDLKSSVCKKDRYGYVYHTLFTRPTDGKTFHYIGQHVSQTLDRRYPGSGMLLRRMITKHGLHGNTRVRILSWETNQDDLNTTEIMMIRNAKQLWGAACVNLAYGGSVGKHHPHTRQLMSAARIGKIQSIVTRERRAASLRGKIRSATLCANIAAAKKGEIRSPEFCAAASARFKGIKKPQVACPHCGTVGGVPVMKRWHFDNCTV